MKKQLFLLLAVLLAGCSGNSPTGPSPAPVAQKTFVDLAIAPPAKVMVGETQQSRATAKWSDGTSEDVTNQVAWKSSSYDVAEINSNGTLKGLKAGDTLVWVENFRGTNYSAPLRTVVEGSSATNPEFEIEFQLVTFQNGATLKFAAPGVDAADRQATVLVRRVPEEYRKDPSARVWVCLKNQPITRIVGSCSGKLLELGVRMDFYPSLWVSDPFHTSLSETTMVGAYLTKTVQNSFNSNLAEGNSYQRPDVDEWVVAHAVVQRQVKWQR